MSFLTEILAVAVVWLSSFALCQFGVAVEGRVHLPAKTERVKTVAKSPRDATVKSGPPKITGAADATGAARRGA